MVWKLLVRCTEAHGALKDSGVSSVSGTDGGGAPLGLAPLLRNAFCVSASSKRLSRVSPWDLAPPEAWVPFARLKDADFCGIGPRGPLMDDALWSHLVRALLATAGLGSRRGTHCLCPWGLRLLSFSVPPEVTGLFHPACCWWKSIWGFSLG